MYQIILIVHVLIALAMIVLILLQQGKGATMGAAFGSGASQTVFGSVGSGSFLLRLTGGLAAAFFATSLLLGYIASTEAKQLKQFSIPGTNITAPVKERSTSKPQAPTSESTSKQ